MQKAKTTLQSIIEKKRYLLFFVIISAALLYGRNFSSGNSLETDQINSLQRKIEELKSEKKGTFEWGSDKRILKVNGVLNLNPGDGERVFFTGKTTSLKNNSEKTLKLKVYLESETNEKQLVKTFELEADDEKIYEVDFISNSRFSNLLFEKENLLYGGNIIISDITPVRLYAGNQNELSNLKPTLIGQTKNSPTNALQNSEDYDVEYRITRKNEMIGQVVEGSGQYVSYAEIKMKFVGNGGSGNYFLELREVKKDDNGQLTVLPQRLAYYYFDKESADKLLKDKENSIYRFPLAAKMESGKMYVININNSPAEFNYFNTLSIYGKKRSNDEQNGFISISGRTNRNPDIYLQIYGADYNVVDNERLLTGATIQDLGNHKGSYHYEMTQKPSDFLDIHEVKEDGNVFFDNVQKGISGLTHDNANFIYKFYTKYQIEKAAINLTEGLGGNFNDCLVYYSFDEKNWTEIKSLKSEIDSQPDRFYALVNGDGKSNSIYLKVTYNPADWNHTIDMFLVKELKIQADLVL